MTTEKRGWVTVVSIDRSPFKLFSLKFSNKSVQAPGRSVNSTCGNLQLVSTTPAVNLPPVANNGNNIRLLRPESELQGKNVSIR
jgi:hypothetical protein